MPEFFNWQPQLGHVKTFSTLFICKMITHKGKIVELFQHIAECYSMSQNPIKSTLKKQLKELPFMYYLFSTSSLSSPAFFLKSFRNGTRNFGAFIQIIFIFHPTILIRIYDGERCFVKSRLRLLEDEGVGLFAYVGLTHRYMFR